MKASMDERRAALVLVLAVVSLSACSIDNNYIDPGREVQDCVERGGVPTFTHHNGRVVTFLGCTEGGAS